MTLLFEAFLLKNPFVNLSFFQKYDEEGYPIEYNDTDEESDVLDDDEDELEVEDSDDSKEGFE